MQVARAAGLPCQAPAARGVGRRRTVVPSCKKEGTGHESSAYRNNLRKGFAPVKKENRPKQNNPNSAASKPSTPGSKSLVLGADDFSMDKWREVDKQMNKYPGSRSFTAIGTGSEEFKNSMIEAVTSVVGGPLLPEQVSQRPSSKGQYISVTIGPVTVTSPEQVVKIFANMKTDSRLKWFM